MSELLTRRFIDALVEELGLDQELPESLIEEIRQDFPTYVHLSPVTEHRLVASETEGCVKATTLFLRSVTRHFMKRCLQDIDWDDVEFIIRQRAAAEKARRAYESQDSLPGSGGSG